jgi:hypothetical protein
MACRPYLPDLFLEPDVRYDRCPTAFAAEHRRRRVDVTR